MTALQQLLTILSAFIPYLVNAKRLTDMKNFRFALFSIVIAIITLFAVVQIAARSAYDTVVTVQEGYLSVKETNGVTLVGDVKLDKSKPFDELRKVGLESARGLGLAGNPVTEDIVVMTLDAYFSVSQSWIPTSKASQSPVYIYSASGKIETPMVYGLGHFPADTVFTGVEIILDAETGDPISVGIRPSYATPTDYKKVLAPEFRPTFSPPATLVPYPTLTVDEKEARGLSADFDPNPPNSAFPLPTTSSN
jgi:hypothetical protein